jgi:hypothetical protein
VSTVPPEKTAYRNALLWAFDRLSVTGGMSPKEQRYTMQQIGNVLRGIPSPAGTYEPNEWDDSQTLLRS